MSAKRKHATLTLQEKIQIIESLNKGVSKNILAEKYKIGRATIYDIQKNKEKIQKFVSNVNTAHENRKTLKCAKNVKLEKALYTWFLQERRRNTPISGPILSAKAKYFYEKITGKSDFSASTGWLEGFKKRHGVRFLKTKGEKLSCNLNLNWSPSQLYNADASVEGKYEHNVVAEYLSDENTAELANYAVDEEKEDDDLPILAISKKASEAIKSFDICIKWAEEQRYPFMEILLLKRMQDKALTMN